MKKIEFYVYTKNYEKMTEGYIYILSNEAMPNLYKIGKSKFGGINRANDIYKGHSGVPCPFEAIVECKVDDMNIMEKKIHKILDNFRYKTNREFFEIKYDTLKDILKEKFPELIWLEPHDNEIIKGNNKNWKNFEENLINLKNDANLFKQYAVKNKWFDHKDCYDGCMLIESEYKVTIEQPLKWLQEGLERRPEAIKNNLIYLKNDDKNMKKELKELEILLNNWKVRFNNWELHTGPCMCMSHINERIKDEKKT